VNYRAILGEEERTVVEAFAWRRRDHVEDLVVQIGDFCLFMNCPTCRIEHVVTVDHLLWTSAPQSA
jgi:hypothetical protein